MSAPKLELRQGQNQSLVMTQALQQSIKLLQCNAQELRQFVERELEQNPFLTQEEPEGETPSEEEKPAAESEGDEAPREADFAGDENFSSEVQGGESWGDDSAEIESDYLRHDQHIGTGHADFGGDDDMRGIDDNPSQGISLRDYLLEQLHIETDDAVSRLIGAHLIDLIDEAGYLKEDLGAVAETLGADAAQVENTLALLQSFDPPGIVARNLSECLSLQLRDKNRLDPAMQALLSHLHLLGDGKFDELQKKCGVDKDDLRQMVAEIRELNPKP
ncbi:MAG: RNA polymerase sigma-54 factor, partial [Pseudomonadota bacterium]|nr:RNA polymerase sigma-54 factor [Pseudomonadota bacterium]